MKKLKVQRLNKRTSVRDRLRAMELLAKIKGWFIDKKELEFKDMKPIIFIDDVGEWEKLERGERAVDMNGDEIKI